MKSVGKMVAGFDRASGSAAFTLLETFVTLSIIVILVGLLGMSYAPVTRKVKEIRCMNAMRAVGNAIHLYAGDHRQFTPNLLETTDMDVRNELVRYNDSIKTLKCPYFPVGPAFESIPPYLCPAVDGIDLSRVPPDFVLLMDILKGHPKKGVYKSMLLYVDNRMELEP